MPAPDPRAPDPVSPGRARRIPAAGAAAAVAALLHLPGLGGPGLVDPWEPHYAEVSRQMVVRGDWVHPWWNGKPFLSKPPLLLWGGAAGLALAPEGREEWGVRLPVALLAVAAAAFAAAAVSRLASPRAGLLAGVALSSAPFLALFARQAVPDAPLAALSTSAGLALAVALLDDRAGPGWARAGWVLLGLAALAKGPVGVVLPAGAVLAWLAVTGEWRRAGRLGLVERVGRVPVPVGPLLLLAVALPWYVAMAAWPARDEAGLDFVRRFWLHDHLQRFAAGVHAPVAMGGFLPYLGHLATGTFPWVAALPGGLGEALRTRGAPRDARGGLALLCGLWALLGWVALSLARTRYPHYALPLAPPLLLLGALFLDRVLDEGPRRHALAIGLGALALAASGAALARSPRLLTALFTYDPRRAWPEAALDALHPVVGLGPLPLSARPGAVLAAATLAGLMLLLGGLALRSSRTVVGGLAAVALLVGAWVSWVHWAELAPHWSQREAFLALRAERPGPDEPIVAWHMGWRGEVFYGGGRVLEVNDLPRMRELAARPGRTFVVTEPERIPSLRGAVGPGRPIRVAGPDGGRYRLIVVGEAGPAAQGAGP